MALSVSIISKKNSLVFLKLQFKQNFRIHVSALSKLTSQLFSNICVKCILGLCFVVCTVYYICFAQVINICIEIFVQSFTHTVQFLTYRCVYAMPLFLSQCHHIILPSQHTAIISHYHQIIMT